MYEILSPTIARFTKTTDGSDEEFTILVAVNQEDQERCKSFYVINEKL